MPAYVFKAKNEHAQTISGEIEAASEDVALDLISREGLIPVMIKESAGFVEQKAEVVKGRPRGRVRVSDLYGFCRQLSGLLKSGLPLIRCLDLLSQQSVSRKMRHTLSLICMDIRNGQSFSEALSDHPDVFSSMFQSMVTAGEESGRLPQVLKSMAVYLKNRDNLGRQIRSAMAYPALMAVVGLVTVIFIMTKVLPKITVLFSQSNIQLPWPTRILINVSQVVQGGWAWGVLIIAFSLLAIRAAYLSGRSRNFWNNVYYQIPFFKIFILKVELERFSRTMHLLLASGLPILRSLQIAMQTVGNRALRRDILIASEDLSQGDSLGHSLSMSRTFPSLYGQLVAVGEESGDLPGTFADLSEQFESEIREETKTFTTLIEPLMILLVGSVVGFIVFAMLMPVFSMDVLAR